MIERVRKVDVEKMSEEQLERAVELVGAKLAQICEKAAKEANDILKIYGLYTEIQFLSPKPLVDKQ